MSLTAVGLGDPNSTDTSMVGLVVSTAMMIVFTVLVGRLADASGISRSRPASAEAEAQEAVPAALPATVR